MSDQLSEIRVGDTWFHTYYKDVRLEICKIDDDQVWMGNTHDDNVVSISTLRNSWEPVIEASCWVCKGTGKSKSSLPSPALHMCMKCYGTGFTTGGIYKRAAAAFDQSINDAIDSLGTHELSSEELAIVPESDMTKSFQERVHPWLEACFGTETLNDKNERNHRFLEESLELVQSTGCSVSEAHQMVDYVFSRDKGEPVQEVGGVMISLAGLCLANVLDMDTAGELELERVGDNMEKIRAKHETKPKIVDSDKQMCGTCFHFTRCHKLVGAQPEWEHCDWSPSRYVSNIEYTPMVKKK